MTTREKLVQDARQLVSDAQLIAFLVAIRKRYGVRDAEYFASRFDRGDGLDQLFYTGEAWGYYLSARKAPDTALRIVLGCQDGPLSDEGSEWLVSFVGSDMASIRHVVSWMC
jgi:hypothetical protein